MQENSGQVKRNYKVTTLHDKTSIQKGAKVDYNIDENPEILKNNILQPAVPLYRQEKLKIKNQTIFEQFYLRNKNSS